MGESGDGLILGLRSGTKFSFCARGMQECRSAPLHFCILQFPLKDHYEFVSFHILNGFDIADIRLRYDT